MTNHESTYLTIDITDESTNGDKSHSPADYMAQTSHGFLESYKPRAIRTTTLLIIILISCGLIASLDVGGRTFSSHETPSLLNHDNSTEPQRR
jgi:hypothetical protein